MASDIHHQSAVTGQQQAQPKASNDTPSQQMYNHEQFMLNTVCQGDYLFTGIGNRQEHNDNFSSSDNYNICNTYEYQLKSSPRAFTPQTFEQSNTRSSSSGEYSVPADVIDPLNLEVSGNTAAITPTIATHVPSTFPPHSSMSIPTNSTIQHGVCTTTGNQDSMFTKEESTNDVCYSASKRKQVDLEAENAYKRLRVDSNYDQHLYYQLDQPRDTTYTQAVAARSGSGLSKRSSAWTKNEEAKLQQLVNAGVKWQYITREFPNRSAGAIKKHYYADMKNIPWSEEEDSLLQQFFKEHETWKWKDIGEKIGKPAAACKKRMKQIQQKTIGYSTQVTEANSSGSGSNPDEY